MKILKFLFVLLICILITNVCAFSKTSDDEVDETETIVVKNLHGVDFENQRSIYSLECVLYRNSKQVKVNYSGLGNINVYILDLYGNIINYQYGSVVEESIILSPISATGLLRIYIESDRFIGEGYFIIFD